MIAQLLTVIITFSFIPFTLACQPSPITTTQQVRAIVANNPVLNSARLINVEPSQVPLPPAAPIQSLFEFLKIPIPTIPSILSQSTITTTLNPLNSTEDSNSTLFDSPINNSTYFDPELEPSNSTENTDNLIKDLALAEQSVLSSFKDPIETTKPTLKLFAIPETKEESTCENATITAITIMPYDDRLVGIDLDRVHEQLKLLETYTGKNLSSFGEYSEEVTNIDGKFALRFNIKETSDCLELRNFATKSVSYSREIERVQFACHCQPLWIIAKRKPSTDKTL